MSPRSVHASRSPSAADRKPLRFRGRTPGRARTLTLRPAGPDAGALVGDTLADARLLDGLLGRPVAETASAHLVLLAARAAGVTVVVLPDLPPAARPG